MRVFEFVKPVGLLVAPPAHTPINYFRLIMNDSFLELLLRETNYNAEQVLHSEVGVHEPVENYPMETTTKAGTTNFFRTNFSHENNTIIQISGLLENGSTI